MGHPWNTHSTSQPCFHCKDRVLGCHENCQKYKDFKSEMNYISTRRKETVDLSSWKNEINITRKF